MRSRFRFLFAVALATGFWSLALQANQHPPRPLRSDAAMVRGMTTPGWQLRLEQSLDEARARADEVEQADARALAAARRVALLDVSPGEEASVLWYRIDGDEVPRAVQVRVAGETVMTLAPRDPALDPPPWRAAGPPGLDEAEVELVAMD